MIWVHSPTVLGANSLTISGGGGGGGGGGRRSACRGWVPLPLDKVFVSVYAITETNTTYAKYGTSGRGSSHCLFSSGTLLCRRDLKCHIQLQTECSPASNGHQRHV